MKFYLKTIISLQLLSVSFAFSQTKYYEFPVFDGSKTLTMKQTNELVQNSSRLLSSTIITGENVRRDGFAQIGMLTLNILLLHPITHEEGHRSILTNLNIGAISQPIVDKNGVAKVIGVTDATLKNLRDTDLPDYIRLHTAGLESDIAYLNSLNAKLSFEEEESKFVKMDLFGRSSGVAMYYLTSWINRKFKLEEYKTPELERDIVGHDIWGMIRHIHRPTMDFHRYTTWDELTEEEKKFANKTAIFSLINLANPNLFNIRNFTLKNGNKLGFNLGYSLSPFGDYFSQNIYYFMPNKNIKLNPYLIEYFNKNSFFFGAGVKLHNFEYKNKYLFNSSIDFWNQPKELSFTTHKGEFGFGGNINAAYKFFETETKNKSFYANLGISYKTKGFVPEQPSLKEDFRINAGVIYSIN